MFRHPLAAAGALIALLSACGSSATQVMVEVESDLVAPQEIDEVRFSVRGGTGDPREIVVAVTGPESFPLSVAVVHDGGALSGYSVEVIAAKAGAEVRRESRPLVFQRGKVTRVQIRLLRAEAPDGSVSPDAGLPDGPAEERDADAGQPADAPEPGGQVPDAGGDTARPDVPAEAPTAGDAQDAPAEAPAADARSAEVSPEAAPPDRAPMCPDCVECNRTNCGSGAGRCECRSGCTCRQTCASGSDCDIRCQGPNTTCTGTAQPGGNVQLSCDDGATCTFEAVAASNVTVECRDRSSCSVDCRLSSNCFASCSGDSVCVLRCSPDKNCRFVTCAGRLQACPGTPGLSTCNGVCP